MDKQLNLTQKMDFGKIFEWAFKLYFQKHFFFIIRSMSYFFIPGMILMIIFAFFGYRFFSEFFGEVMAMTLNPDSISDSGSIRFLTSIVKLYGMIFGAYAVIGIFIGGASAASVKAISVKLENGTETEADIAKETLRKLVPLIITTIITGVIVGFGSFFCYIPGIMFMIFLIFIPQIVMLENTYFFKAIGRSFSLVNKNFWSIFLIGLVFYFLYSTISSLVGTPFYIVPYVKMVMQLMQNSGEFDPSIMMNSMNSIAVGISIMMVVMGIVGIFYLPLVNTAFTLKYYNIRNLREGKQILDTLDDGSGNDPVA